MLQHSGVPSPEENSTTRTTWEEGGIRVSDQIPLERRGTFPQNYVESNHRREWFQEKFGSETEPEACDESTPVEDIQPGDQNITSTTTPVLPMEPHSEDEVMSVVVVEEGEEVVSDQQKEQETETEVTSFNQQTSEDTEARQTEAETDVEVEVEGAVGGVSVTDNNTEQPEAAFLKQSFDHLSDKVGLYRGQISTLKPLSLSL